MASVQELLLAAEAKKTRSPLLDLLETGIQGFQTGQNIRDKNLDIATKLLQMQEIERKAQQLQMEQEKKAKAQAEMREQDINAGKMEVGKKPTPAFPQDRMIKKLSRNAEGDYSWEEVQPKLPNESQSISPSLLYQMQKDQQKGEMDFKELQIPDYELGSEVRPTSPEAKSLRDTKGRMDDFANGIDQMISLIRKHGSTNLVGEGSGEMESLASNLKLTLKDVAKLGVLSASDLALVEGQISDPSKISSLGTRTENVIKKLEKAKERAMQLTESSLKTSGYSRRNSTGNTALPKVGDSFQGGKVLSIKRVD